MVFYTFVFISAKRYQESLCEPEFWQMSVCCDRWCNNLQLASSCAGFKYTPQENHHKISQSNNLIILQSFSILTSFFFFVENEQ